MKENPSEDKIKKRLGRVVKEIMSYTPYKPPRKPVKAPSKAELQKRYKLEV